MIAKNYPLARSPGHKNQKPLISNIDQKLWPCQASLKEGKEGRKGQLQAPIISLNQTTPFFKGPHYYHKQVKQQQHPPQVSILNLSTHIHVKPLHFPDFPLLHSPPIFPRFFSFFFFFFFSFSFLQRLDAKN